MLKKEILDILNDEKIEYAEALPYELLRKNQNCRKAFPFDISSVIVFLIPYYNGGEKGNISLYARANDYHLYCKKLEEVILPKLKNILGDAVILADTSPIYETEAAALAGLGVIGEHGLLINEKYSSFVFIGGIFTSVPYEKLTDKRSFGVKHCDSCGKCKIACPVSLDKNRCLSQITQKKGELTADEAELIKCHSTVWGCDICQFSCPHTDKMINCGYITEIDFFKNDLVNFITREYIENISNEELKNRAFSWRGKKVLLRNIDICEKK